ncbi:hypothetical protein Syun_010733 [Stephania yunnanensis]|uniref:RING-type domain-containing protein n=1 Tax=Stephania yunnanensis TaxID=152371 RepID=A0AAP0PRY7_9MAGN
MAVEARHLNFFSPQQLINSREIAMNGVESVQHHHHHHHHNQIHHNLNAQMDLGLPLSGTTVDTLLPFYNSVVVDSVPAMKAESGLTYNPSSSMLSRKRSRDHHQFPTTTTNTNNNNTISYSNSPNFKDITTTIHNSSINNGLGFGFTFMGEDISFQIQQQQIEIDRLIAHHTEKLLLGIAERRKTQARRLVAAIEEGMAKRLRVKEEEIEKMGKLNWVLEERIKTLCFENQIWRDLAQTNEATANALRANLEQVLSKVRDDRTAEADDAASSCGSSDFGQVLHRDNQNEDCDNEEYHEEYHHHHQNKKKSKSNQTDKRLCRNCGKEESCVLLLPCRHLCLCGVCGPTLHTCPICKSDKNGTVNVNMS